MTPGRWRLVEELYHDALARDIGERPAFLREACAGDEALRHEVESLLAQPASAEGALHTGGAAEAAATMMDGPPSVLIGRRVGAYQVQTLLGVGGMGEVYRARDTKLGRDVAIKILPRAFTADSERLARFEREARVLASLNHPNIATIHGIEDADGIPALVLELVEGVTLAERLSSALDGRKRHAGLPLADALSIARQMADALEAAHEKGIVHRDPLTAVGLVLPECRERIAVNRASRANRFLN